MPDDYKPPTVADLIDKLSTLDPTLPVVLAEDEEGNGFDTWSGDAVPSLYHTERRETYMTPEQFAAEIANPNSRFDPVDDAPPEIGGPIVRAVVLWP